MQTDLLLKTHHVSLESLEARIALDGTGLCGIDFEDSALVTEFDDGTLGFASLNVGRVSSGQVAESSLLGDEDHVVVRDYTLEVQQIKEFLHGFANEIGSDPFVETSDLRELAWGSGASSTVRRFEDYIVNQIETQQPCQGLRFASSIRFELPGEGGEFFTGGFLELEQEGSVDSLLRGGDIVEVVEGYTIESTVARTTLVVQGMFGDMSFTISPDLTLTDEFDRIWHPESDYQIVDPNAVDDVLGDVDGNGIVEMADFLLLAENFGKETDTGDLNGDGFVSFVDFLILAKNFGNSS